MTRLLALLVLCALTVPASAHKSKHHKAHVQAAQLIVCDQQGCRGVKALVQHVVIDKHRRAVVDRRQDAAQGAVEGTQCCLIAAARHYLGQTSAQIGVRRTQWCAAFLRHLGVKGPVDDRAISFSHLPHVSPQVGAIAVFPHHVGIVTGFDGPYPILISGNSTGRRVYEGTYPRRPLAYVMPG